MRGAGKEREREGRGFTLIELIAVIAVMGILVVTAMVKSGMSQRDLDAVAKSLRSNLQFAQELAMTRGATFGFHARSQTQYEIFEGAAGTPATNPLDGSSFVVAISPVVFSGTPADIPFLKSGRPNIVTDATILLIGSGGTRTITVQQDTGFVTLASP